MKSISFRDEARIELLDGIRRNEDGRVGYGERFRNAIDRLNELISRFPEIGAGYPKTDCRECVMTDFPYSVIYLELADSIEIIAIAHAKRRRGYWKSRLPRS